MATFDEYMAAARNAHSAGDAAAARQLVQSAKKIRTLEGAKAGTLKVSPERLAQQSAIDQMAGDEMLLQSNPPGLNQITKFAQGIPFVGQYSDELTGLVSPRGAEMQRATQDAMDRQRPVQSAILETAGGITGSVAMAPAAMGAISAAAPATLGGQVLAGAGAGALAGGIEGGISGYGRGTGDQRAGNALSGAGLGAAFGGAAGAVAPAVSRGVTALAERAKGMDVAKISEVFGIDRAAAQALKADIDALDPVVAQRNLATAGPDAMLADAGISTREALDAAITGGGKAATIGTDAVSQRAAAAGSKLTKTMDAVLGDPRGVQAGARNIAHRTAPMRQRAYDKAYTFPIDYASDAGQNIEGVLRRIPSRTLNEAIREANEAMQAAGVRNQQILAEIADDGSVTFREMPNVQQLDEIKKALGSVLQSETDPVTGRVTAAGIRARKLARDLRDAVGEAVPTYRTAVKLGGDKIAEDQAFDMGGKIFGPSVTREQVADTMEGASVEARIAAQQGIREYIDNTLARVRRGFDDPSVDTRETLSLLNALSSKDARDKLRVVLGQSKADRLFTDIDAAGKQFGTRQAIATGSATGRREARSRALDNALAPGVIGTMQQGSFPQTAKAVVQLITRETPQAQLARRQEVLAQVAQALTQKRGPAAAEALEIVQRAIQGQPVKSAEALRVGKLISTTGVLAGYQSGTRSLSGPSNAQ